jgi:hypothetical protein
MVMKRLPLLLLLFCSAFLFAAPKDKDSFIQELIEKHGGAQIKNDHAVASGTIYYADKTSKAFTLTAKKRILRMDIRSADQSMTIVRNGGRSQVAKGSDIGYPNRTSRSGSAINLLPIFTLLEFSDDPRFTNAVVREKDGSSSVTFVEGTPPGVKPPPFPQPKLRAIFSLDSVGRIAKVAYQEEGKSSKAVSYQYSYDPTVAGSFLQPSQVICMNGESQAWTATVNSIRKQASVQSDFFKILETRERMKLHE